MREAPADIFPGWLATEKRQAMTKPFRCAGGSISRWQTVLAGMHRRRRSEYTALCKSRLKRHLLETICEGVENAFWKTSFWASCRDNLPQHTSRIARGEPPEHKTGR